MDEKQEHPLLEWAAAEGGIRNEEVATLGNLVKVVNGSVYDAHVLRYVFDRGGRQRLVELPYAQMGGSPWINCSEKTVARSVLFWEELDILEIERDRGRQLPNRGRLRWSSVLQRLLGGSGSVSSPPPPSGDYPDPSDDQGNRPGGFSNGMGGLSVPMGGLSVHMGGQPVHMGGLSVHMGGQPVHPSAQNPPDSCNPICVRARAAGFSILFNSLIVDVDNLESEEGIPFLDVWALAEEARRIIWPMKWPRDPEVKQSFARAAILALMLFSREWMLAASRATKRKRPEHPSTYWIAALRNGLVETQGFPEFKTPEEARSYISQLLNTVAPIATEVVAQYAQPETVVAAVAVAERSPTTPDTKKEFLARMARVKEAAT